jgi:hypothetical protein
LFVDWWVGELEDDDQRRGRCDRRLLSYAVSAFRRSVYTISGTSNGQPYKTRLVVRQPSNTSSFSGLVLTEPMHPSGSDHRFEFTSIYSMTAGHVPVAVITGGRQGVIDANPQRYAGLSVSSPIRSVRARR